MANNSNKMSAVPTNLITGFLGTGKTTAILHLLSKKPKKERWAILVNEFGEIGVDGSFFEGNHAEQQNVFIREVPGGCMCCAAGLPMQIALNQLLARAEPDRLLIEPTGLGHPEEVVNTLAADHYQEILDLQKIITLVDARKLSDKRYTEHPTFNQQISIADTVVGNKLDLYAGDEKNKLKDYLSQHNPGADLIFTSNGQIEDLYLQGKTASTSTSRHLHHHAAAKPLISELPIPACGFLKAVNEGEGFHSIGWRFSPDRIFSRKKLFAFLNGISAERMKAVFMTDQGIYGYDLTPDALTEFSVDDCKESRIEIITDVIKEEWEGQLMNCLIAK